MTKPPVNPKINIEDFIRERDAVLAKGDLLEMARFYKKHNPGFDSPELKEEVLEIALHKARSGAKSLPLELRQEAHQWLLDRGYGSFADDITPTKEDTDAQEEAQVLTPTGTGSNPDDPASPEPEQPAVDVPVVPGSSSEAPTG